ncbi:MAG: hypothetical protein RPS47_01520 [Colwellia sp.]
MNLNIDDFCEKHYRDILQLAVSSGYEFVGYNEFSKKGKIALWRHDIDFSPQRALALAEIEHDCGVKSTYFIQLNSWFYNVFETEIRNIFTKIKELGHDFGLHFDVAAYNVKDRSSFERKLSFEKNTLEELLSIKINSFSFHNPSEFVSDFQETVIADMLNVYCSEIVNKYEYCSDSNGFWRFKRMVDFVGNDFQYIQVLTHPGWWQRDSMRPRDRILRCLEGRSQSTISQYDSLLESFGRKNF